MSQWLNKLGKSVNNYALLIIILHLFFLWPLIKFPFYKSHDGIDQVARIGAYVKAFRDFHIPPRWAGDLNFHYGSPVLNFYYPLSGYLGALFYFFGFSLENSFKLIAGLAFILAPLFFYQWMNLYYSKSASFVGALFYGLAPYHFLNLYVRGDIGELLAYVFVPVVFYSVDMSNKNSSYIKRGLFYALLILSHQGVALIVSPILLFYTIYLSNFDIKKLAQGIIIILIGLGLSFYYWFPALTENKYTNADLFIGKMYLQHFPNLSQIVWSSWNFGADVTKNYGLSPQIGPIHLILALVLIIIICKEKKKNGFVLFWLAILFISIFLSLSISNFIWQQTPLLSKLQFPWRFIGISSLAASICATSALNKISKQSFYLLVIVLLLISTWSKTNIEKQIHYPNSYYFNFPGTTYSHGEASTIWSAGDPGDFPKKSLDSDSGTTQIQELSRNTVKHIYKINALDPDLLIENTLYYPGWQVKVNKLNVPIEFQNINHRGLITFSVPKGINIVEVSFHETKFRLAADLISLITFVWLIAQLFFNQFRYNHKGS